MVGPAENPLVGLWARGGWAQLLRLELTVFSDNHRAIRLYESLGFVHEGTHRAYAMRHGRYADANVMARLHPAQPQLA